MWAYLCSDAQRQQVRERGEDPDALARIYARVLNRALEGKPADLTVGLHVCRVTSVQPDLGRRLRAGCRGAVWQR